MKIIFCIFSAKASSGEVSNGSEINHILCKEFQGTLPKVCIH